MRYILHILHIPHDRGKILWEYVIYFSYTISVIRSIWIITDIVYENNLSFIMVHNCLNYILRFLYTITYKHEKIKNNYWTYVLLYNI